MKLHCSLGAFTILLLLGLPAARATTFTWNGDSTNSNNWSDSSNWLNGSVPTSGTATDIVFSSAGANTASTPNSYQDLPPSPFLVNTMTFSSPGTSTFTLGGGNLAFTQSKLLTQSSGTPVTISNAISINGFSGGAVDLTVAGAGNGLLTLSGGVNTGSSPFRKQGSSTVAFSATSQFYSMTIEGGTVRNSAQQVSAVLSHSPPPQPPPLTTSCRPARSPQIMAKRSEARALASSTRAVEATRPDRER